MRIAVLLKDRCQPKRCSMECIKYCPRVRAGDETIVIGEDGKPVISEELCIGCGICVHRCPFDAIKIVGLPEELETDLVHQFGKNGFRLFRLPIPKKGTCIGIIGPNGIGKTTVINILSGRIIPNLGDIDSKPSWEKVLDRFRGTELYEYINDLANGNIVAISKPQYIDKIPKIMKGKVRDVLKNLDEIDGFDDVVKKLSIENILDKNIESGFLSGGELQLMAIAATLLKDANVYFFDEPTSYLDIYQRLNVSRVIRDLSRRKNVVVVEHDLAIMDFLCDVSHLLYGEEGVFGIVTHPKSIRHAINTYLSGYLKEENIRFGEAIEFQEHPPKQRQDLPVLVTFQHITKIFSDFNLTVETGAIRSGEVVGIVGPNSIGKTTFVRILAGIIEPTDGEIDKKVTISYKPQHIYINVEEKVQDYLLKEAEQLFISNFYKKEIFDSLNLRHLLDRRISSLSGGELQRVSIASCLAKDVDLYLIDEPSAYLDSKQRMITSKAIKRVMEKMGKSALVVDHDVYFIDMISDSLMVFEGTPGKKGIGRGPFSLHEGMNRFLKEVDITFRRDEETKRPRVNKVGSYMDRHQREIGEYYYSNT